MAGKGVLRLKVVADDDVHHGGDFVGSESVALVALVVVVDDELHDDDNMTKKVVSVELVVLVGDSSVVAVVAVVAVVEAVHEREIGQLVGEAELAVGYWWWIDTNDADVDEKDLSTVEVGQL